MKAHAFKAFLHLHEQAHFVVGGRADLSPQTLHLGGREKNVGELGGRVATAQGDANLDLFDDTVAFKM